MKNHGESEYSRAFIYFDDLVFDFECAVGHVLPITREFLTAWLSSWSHFLLPGSWFHSSSINGLGAYFQSARWFNDRLSCLRSMWLYSLNQSSLSGCLLSRIIFGMAVGLLNVSAIAIISERYKGKERVQTLGIRGSAEVVGTAVLTFESAFWLLWLAGCLSRLRYQYSYLTFVSLYLCHMDLRRKQWRKNTGMSCRWQGNGRQHSAWAVVAAAIVLSNVMITVRFQVW